MKVKYRIGAKYRMHMDKTKKRTLGCCAGREKK